MKIIKISILSMVLAFGGMSFVNNTNSNTSIETSIESEGSSIKLINDTGEKVKLKLPSGSMSLNNSGSTSFSCKIGGKVYVDGSFVHTVSDDDCGRTIKLSSWM